MSWNEHMIARALALQTFGRQHLVVVDNCNWTGHECDLLVVTQNLRVIDVEIKISRADLRADAKKDKWWHRFGTQYVNGAYVTPDPLPQQWPRRVWKHFYAMPEEIWKPEMLELCKKDSGVLLLKHGTPAMPVVVKCIRKSTPNKQAAKLSHESVADIARLASLRMWESYKRLAEREQVAA